MTVGHEREQLKRYVQVEMQRLTGRRYSQLSDEVDRLSFGALQDMRRFLVDVTYEMAREKRTYRPFPGAPRVL